MSVLISSSHSDAIEITSAAIKSALNTQLYGSRIRTPHPLEQLTLVEQTIAQFPLPSKYRRAMTLGSILTTLITDQLAKYRLSMDCGHLTLETSLKHAVESISADVRTANRELLSWSWLYYHYVRVDFGIHARLFCQLCHIDERTLRRYQAHALQRLAIILIEREWQARCQRDPSSASQDR